MLALRCPTSAGRIVGRRERIDPLRAGGQFRGQKLAVAGLDLAASDPNPALAAVELHAVLLHAGVLFTPPFHSLPNKSTFPKMVMHNGNFSRRYRRVIDRNVGQR
jgi:hypothetical protein